MNAFLMMNSTSILSKAGFALHREEEQTEAPLGLSLYSSPSCLVEAAHVLVQGFGDERAGQDGSVVGPVLILRFFN